MTAPSKAERDAAIAAAVALPGSALHRMPAAAAAHAQQAAMGTAWVVPGAAEFAPFLAIYDALVGRFGADADARFAAVLNNITRARRQSKRQQYNAARRARPRTRPRPKRSAEHALPTMPPTAPAHELTRN